VHQDEISLSNNAQNQLIMADIVSMLKDFYVNIRYEFKISFKYDIESGFYRAETLTILKSIGNNHESRPRHAVI
jgi:hypothetical protein